MNHIPVIASAIGAFGYYLIASTRSAGEPGDLIFVYHATPRHFAADLESQLRYLRAKFHVLPLRSLITHRREQRSPGSLARAAITFDDGLRSNVEVAYPLLRKLGIPATFFVCPGLIEEKRWLWTHEVRRRLARVAAGARKELAHEFAALSGIEAFIGWMKTLAPAERRTVEARVREATPHFVASARDHDLFGVASWRELRALDPKVVTVESHTMTHPMLVKMSEGELETELGGSRRMIESRLERPVGILAYPNGEADAGTIACARRHYGAAVTIDDAPQRFTERHDRYLVPRVVAAPSVLRLVWMLERPHLWAPRRASSAESASLAR